MGVLGLKGYHALITGASGATGQEAVKEFLDQGCNVTAFYTDNVPVPSPPNPNFFSVTGDIGSESSIASGLKLAVAQFGPINILVANTDTSDDISRHNIWDTPLGDWEQFYGTHIRGPLLLIKQFLCNVSEAQHEKNAALENVAIVIAGPESGKFGQSSRSEYASGEVDDLRYGLVRRVKNEIAKINSTARVNAVSYRSVDAAMTTGTKAQVAGPLDKTTLPHDVARTITFLASHRVAQHITGKYIFIDKSIGNQVVWRADEAWQRENDIPSYLDLGILSESGQRFSIPPVITPKRRIQVLLSVDFDAVSGFLGTGASPGNNLADYSSGFFAAQVGVPRLLRLFKKHGIAQSVTWFIPGHSMESFPHETKAIVDSGAEIACHGYAHEGSTQMTEVQERDVISRCVKLATELTGKKPLGWRAPLYQLREHTIRVLEELGFLYDSSLTHRDSELYFLPESVPIKPIDFSPSQPASSWMKPLATPAPRTDKTLVEVPCNWYMEDMTPMQFLPAAENSHGFVSPFTIEQNWRARFEYLYGDTIADGSGSGDFVYPLVLHPDTSGMAHVIGMIDRVVKWLKAMGPEVEFVTYGECAAEWKEKNCV